MKEEEQMKYRGYGWILGVLIVIAMVAGNSVAAEEMIEENAVNRPWHSNIWTQDKGPIVRKGDQVTVTPPEYSPYPTLILKVPNENNKVAGFLFWEAVRFYSEDQPEKALSELEKAHLSEPNLEDVRAAWVIMSDAYDLVMSSQNN
jgi:hypothetical protein